MMIFPMFLLIVLSISYMQPMLAAADDDVVDRSPQGFMVRLRKAEAQDQNDGLERKFIMKQAKGIIDHYEYARSIDCRRLRIYQERPEHKEFADYLEYYEALALSRLSDKKKIKDKFVLIPYFQAGTQEQQREKAGFVSFQVSCWEHPIRRVFLAALCRIEPGDNRLYGISTKNHLLLDSLYHADVHLTKKLLKNGVNPNLVPIEDQTLGYTATWSFKESKTVAEAKLLLKYGADLYEQQKRADIVEQVCLENFEESSDLLRFYLDRIPPSEDNQFGQGWFGRLLDHALSNSYVETDRFSKKCDILLHYGCACDEKALMDMVECEYHRYRPHPERKPQIKRMLQKLLAPAFARSKHLAAIACQPMLESEDVQDLIPSLSEPEREDVQMPIAPVEQSLTGVQSLIRRFNNISENFEKSALKRENEQDLIFPDVQNLIIKFNSMSKDFEEED